MTEKHLTLLSHERLDQTGDCCSRLLVRYCITDSEDPATLRLAAQANFKTLVVSLADTARAVWRYPQTLDLKDLDELQIIMLDFASSRIRQWIESGVAPEAETKIYSDYTPPALNTIQLHVGKPQRVAIPRNKRKLGF